LKEDKSMKCDKCGIDENGCLSFHEGNAYNFCCDCFALRDRLNGVWLIRDFVGPGKESEEEVAIRLAKLRREHVPKQEWKDLKPIFVD
jgi:hypothetical protein